MVDPVDSFRAEWASPPPEAVARVTARVAHEVSRLAPDEDGRRPFGSLAEPERVPRRQFPRSLAAAALIVVALATAGVVAITLNLGEDEQPTTIAALADSARRQPDRELAAGEYHHRVEEAANPAGGERPTMRIERWIARDGSGQERRTVGRDGTERPDPRSTTVDRHSTDDPLDFAGLTYHQVRDLPTRPDRLLRRLREQGLISPPYDAATAEVLADLLSFQVTPPAVRAAAIEALEAIGGQPAGEIDDGTGMVGTAITGTNPDGSTWVVVFDRDTGLTRAFHPHTSSPRSTTDALPLHRRWADHAVVEQPR